MGKTSAKVTWSVSMVCKDAYMHAGAWDDCYDEPCKHKECS